MTRTAWTIAALWLAIAFGSILIGAPPGVFTAAVISGNVWAATALRTTE